MSSTISRSHDYLHDFQTEFERAQPIRRRAACQNFRSTIIVFSLAMLLGFTATARASLLGQTISESVDAFNPSGGPFDPGVFIALSGPDFGSTTVHGTLSFFGGL